MLDHQDGRVTEESSDKTWSIGGQNGKPLQDASHENPMNCIKRQKDVTVKNKPPRSEGVQHVTAGEQRTNTNNSRKKEAARPKQTWLLVVDVSGDESKFHHYKKQYCIGTWNVKYMNQVNWPPNANSWLTGGKSCCWERLKAEGEEGDRGWDGWMASPGQWIWAWANSKRWWGTGKPGMLQSVGSQRIRHELATEQQFLSSKH